MIGFVLAVIVGLIVALLAGLAMSRRVMSSGSQGHHGMRARTSHDGAIGVDSHGDPGTGHSPSGSPADPDADDGSTGEAGDTGGASDCGGIGDGAAGDCGGGDGGGGGGGD